MGSKLYIRTAPSTANLTSTRSNLMLGCFQGMQQLITNMLQVKGRSWVPVNLTAQLNQKYWAWIRPDFTRRVWVSRDQLFFFFFFFLKRN